MNQIKKIWHKYYDYIIIALIYGLLHIFIHTNYWDDATMANNLKSYQYNLVNFLSDIWNIWSSTLFLHGMEFLIVGLPHFIWKIMDVIVIEIIYHYLLQISGLLSTHSVPSSRYIRLWALLFFFNFPYSLFATAGWMITTIAYAWVFAALFYSIYIFLASASGTHIKWLSYIFFGLAVLFSANCNLLSFSMLIIFLFIYITCKTRSKSFNILFIEGIFGTILNIVMFIISPGNKARLIKDARYHDTAELLNMSFGNHLRMGINTTFYHFVSVPNIILFTFCLLLTTCVFYKTKKALIRGISCIPLALDIFWTCYIFFVYTIPSRTLTYIYPDASFQVCPKSEQYFIMASALFMVIAICYLLIYLTDFSYLSWVLVGIMLILGLFPCVVLGFTTTVSASILRVATFFYFSIMLCTYILARIYDVLKPTLWKYVFYSLGWIGGLFNILQIIRHIIVYG